jgi:hypothetical protein
MADAVIEIPARKGKAQTPATSKSSTRTANKSSTPGRSIATTLPSSCQWSIPGRTRSIFHRAGGRQLAQQQAAPDADRHRGYIRGHPRHANRRLRSISYAFLGVAGHHDNCADNLQLALHELHFAACTCRAHSIFLCTFPGTRPAACNLLHRPRVRRAAMSSSAPKWTLSSPSRRARRTSCRSTAAPAVRSRRMSW